MSFQLPRRGRTLRFPPRVLDEDEDSVPPANVGGLQRLASLRPPPPPPVPPRSRRSAHAIDPAEVIAPAFIDPALADDFEEHVPTLALDREAHDLPPALGTVRPFVAPPGMPPLPRPRPETHFSQPKVIISVEAEAPRPPMPVQIAPHFAGRPVSTTAPTAPASWAPTANVRPLPSARPPLSRPSLVAWVVAGIIGGVVSYHAMPLAVERTEALVRDIDGR